MYPRRNSILSSRQNSVLSLFSLSLSLSLSPLSFSLFRRVDLQVGHSRRFYHHATSAAGQGSTVHREFGDARARGQGAGQGEPTTYAVLVQTSGMVSNVCAEELPRPGASHQSRLPDG